MYINSRSKYLANHVFTTAVKVNKGSKMTVAQTNDSLEIKN